MQHDTHRPIALNFRDVTKVFNHHITALDKISFDVPTGQKLVLLGQSGSGKSTLLRHINRLQTPDSGEISVLDQPLSQLRNRQVRALRREIGFIFQDFFLVGSMTVLENVCTGMLGSLLLPRMGVLTYPKAVRRRAIELLERVGIADKAFQRTDHPLRRTTTTCRNRSSADSEPSDPAGRRTGRVPGSRNGPRSPLS